MSRTSSILPRRSGGAPRWKPGRGAIALGGLVSVLVAVERWIPAASGMALLTRGVPWAVSIGLAGAVLVAIRGAVQQKAARDFRLSFAEHVADSCAVRSAMLGSTNSPDQIQSSFFVASSAASRLGSEHLPAIAGNFMALVTLIPLFVTDSSGAAALLCIPMVVLAAGAAFALRRVARAATDRSWGSTRVYVDKVSALLRGHPELVAAGHAKTHASEVKLASRNWVDALLSAEQVGAIGGRLPAAIALATAVVVSWFWLRDQPSVLLAGLSRGLLIASGVALAASLARALVESSRARRDMDALFSIIESVPLDPCSADGAPVLQTDASIELAEVGYTYPGESSHQTAAIRHLSLTWNPHECLGLTGCNGSGKSTILRLLLRFADPDEGAIRVGSTDLSAGDLVHWRSSIAWMPQRPYLPERGTVADAMALVPSELSEHDVLDALSEVGLLAVLERHEPDSPLLTRVEVLSAGERQKLALARVLARRTPILLLDEPDAYLDEDGLARLMSSIRARARTQRVLFVAHGSRLLSCADRVVDLDHLGLAEVQPVSQIREACA